MATSTGTRTSATPAPAGSSRGGTGLRKNALGFPTVLAQSIAVISPTMTAVLIIALCFGDAGDTFVFGDNPDHHRAKSDVRTIWDDVRRVWFDEGITGQELYRYAEKAATDRGWKLNLDLSGHRLSDYPHSAHYDGPLADVGFRPHPNLWVLEIAIAHPDGGFGAFYEDLLLEDQSFPDGVFTAHE